MWRGALAMIDALGFKGIWSRPELHGDSDAVLVMFDALQASTKLAMDEMAREVADLERDEGLRTQIQVIYLSDTVVIGAACEQKDGERSKDADAVALAVVGTIASHIQAQALLAIVPLTYRGCIAFGDFKLSPQFIVGPAVDEAASLMDLADAALVWCTPSASAVVSSVKGPATADSADSPRLYLRDGVPLKGGRLYRTWIVSPFKTVPHTPQARLDYIRRGAGTFRKNVIEDEIKKQNTLAVWRREHKHYEHVASMREMRARRALREAAAQKKE